MPGEGILNCIFLEMIIMFLSNKLKTVLRELFFNEFNDIFAVAVVHGLFNDVILLKKKIIILYYYYIKFGDTFFLF